VDLMFALQLQPVCGEHLGLCRRQCVAPTLARLRTDQVRARCHRFIPACPRRDGHPARRGGGSIPAPELAHAIEHRTATPACGPAKLTQRATRGYARRPVQCCRSAATVWHAPFWPRWLGPQSPNSRFRERHLAESRHVSSHFGSRVARSLSGPLPPPTARAKEARSGRVRSDREGDPMQGKRARAQRAALCRLTTYTSVMAEAVAKRPRQAALQPTLSAFATEPTLA